MTLTSVADAMPGEGPRTGTSSGPEMATEQIILDEEGDHDVFS